MPLPPPPLLLGLLVPLSPCLSFSLKSCISTFTPHGPRVSCSGRGLAAVPDDLPAAAAALDLSSNRIARIGGSALGGLTELRALTFRRNSVSDLDGGTFANQSELLHLDLGYNRISSLPDGAFLGLDKLTSLSLQGNRISSVSPLAFGSLVSLQKVLLGFNLLRRMKDVAPVLRLPALETLHLDSNAFTSFRWEELPRRSGLKELSLVMNPLGAFSVGSSVFRHLRVLLLSAEPGFRWDVPGGDLLGNVTTLVLLGSALRPEVYLEMLRSVGAVTGLGVSYMEDFSGRLVDLACQKPTLRRLDLNLNRFGTIDRTLLRSCSGLAELDLSFDFVELLSESSLRSLKRLRMLDMNNNSLSAVPSAIGELPALEILDLSFNFIGDLRCSDFPRLAGLTELYLGNNRIFRLRGCVFRDLSNLKVLDLAENRLGVLEDTWHLNLRHLEDLNLQMHDLKQLSRGAFGSLTSLRTLSLESDVFFVTHRGAFEGLELLRHLGVSTYVHPTPNFTGTPRLESLRVISASEEECPPADGPHFSALGSLKSLVLRSSDVCAPSGPDPLKGLGSLEELAAEKFFYRTLGADTFRPSPRLRSLKITGSELEDLSPEVLRPVPHLQTLDLSDNKLRSLDFLARASLPELRRLKVSHNQLSVVEERVFGGLPRLLYLDLTGNPFSCNCSNSGFITWAKNNRRTQVLDGYRLTCSSPAGQEGNKLLDFDLRTCRSDVGFFCFLGSCCLLVLTLLAAFTYHLLRWQLLSAYYLVLAFLYDGGRRSDAPLRYDAFVSYNVHDEAWVYQEMLPALEGRQGWRLCLHHRDFLPGRPIMENITDAIYSSRKTICVISRHYLQSEWCSREIQMASFRLFDEQKDVLVLLLLEEIPPHRLSPFHRMRKMLKKRTYLSWSRFGPDPGLFWIQVGRSLRTGDGPPPLPGDDLRPGPRL